MPSRATPTVIITPELYWGEADYVHNLTVVNNTILGVGAGKQGYGGIALGAFAPDGGLAGGGGHRFVVIANNSIVDVGYNPLWIASADGVTVTGNVITTPFPVNPPWATCCENLPGGVVAFVTQTTGALFADNCVYGQGAAAKATFEVTSSVQGEGLADGVRQC